MDQKFLLILLFVYGQKILQNCGLVGFCCRKCTIWELISCEKSRKISTQIKLFIKKNLFSFLPSSDFPQKNKRLFMFIKGKPQKQFSIQLNVYCKEIVVGIWERLNFELLSFLYALWLFHQVCHVKKWFNHDVFYEQTPIFRKMHNVCFPEN